MINKWIGAIIFFTCLTSNAGLACMCAKAFNIPPGLYALHITLTNTLENSPIYINGAKAGNTDKKGNFEGGNKFKIGCYKIEIGEEKKLSYCFNFLKSSYLTCEGSDNFCCTVTNERIKNFSCKKITK